MDQDATEKRRKLIAEEIVSTETTYVEALAVVWTRIIQPLREAANTDNPILSLSEVIDVFANFEVIYNCHVRLLQSLKARIDTWDNLPNMGDVFLEKAGFMILYTHYINNYESSISLVQTYKTNKENFRKFVDNFDLENTTVVDNKFRLRLESFLIMPVQRIPRYVLLLRDLSRHTSEKHTDFAHITTALEEMEQLAKRINNSKSQKDNKEKLHMLQETMANCPFDLLDATERVFLREGYLMQMGLNEKKSGVDKARLLILFNDGILICREGKEKLKFKGWIPLTTAQVEIITTNGHTRNSSEDLTNQQHSLSSPKHAPPLRHQQSSPVLTSPKVNSPHKKQASLGGTALTKKSSSHHVIDFETITNQKFLVLKSPMGIYQFYCSPRPIEADSWYADISRAIENEMQSLIGRNEEKNVESTLKLLKNLLEFEHSYMEKLCLLQKEFIFPLEESIKLRKPVINAEYFNAIFGPFSGEIGIQLLHTRRLAEKISGWAKNSTTITDVYNMEWLSTYKVHVRSYRPQNEALTIVQQEPAFMNFELAHSSQRDETKSIDYNSGVVSLLDLLSDPLRNLSRSYVILRQILLHTTNVEEATHLKDLITAIKQVYEEQQTNEIEEANAIPEEQVKAYSKLKRTLKFWKSRRRNSTPTSPKNLERPEK